MSRGKISDLFFEIGYRVNPIGLNKANDGLKKIKANANASGLQLGKLGMSLSGLASAVLPLMSVGAALGFVTSESLKSINVISEFDDKLRTVVAKIGASEEQLKELSPVTRQVARDYHVMANSVAEAQDYLALAGYSLEEIQEGTEAVVAAQRATGESMKAVSDIATDTASAYGYSADKLEFIVDRMTYTTTKFNTGFAQMGEAMKYIAPIAKQAGMEFEDLNAYIGVLANNSIKGSQAGTALRMAFLRLQAPSKAAQAQLRKHKIALYNSKDEYLGINKVMLNVEKAMKKMTDKEKAMFKQTVFGTEAMSAMEIVLKEGVENIIAYGDAIGQADGKTREMAMFMERGLGGVRRSVEAEKEALSLVLGEALEPAAISFLTHIKNGLEFLREDLEINHQTKSDLAMGFAEIFGQASKLGMAVLYDIPETVDFLTGGLISYIGRKTREKNNRSLNLYPDFKNISFQKLDLYPYDLPGMNYYKKPISDSEEIIEETVEEKVKKIILEIKINGTDTLGKNVATAISEEVQKSFEEAMNYELSTTNINLGRGFSY